MEGGGGVGDGSGSMIVNSEPNNVLKGFIKKTRRTRDIIGIPSVLLRKFFFGSVQ